MNRSTSEYSVSVLADEPKVVVEDLVAAVQATGYSHAASGLEPNRAFVRVRCADDAAAAEMAHTVLGALDYQTEAYLETGYGVNRRRVSMA